MLQYLFLVFSFTKTKTTAKISFALKFVSKDFHFGSMLTLAPKKEMNSISTGKSTSQLT